jgi:hypothetical protein
MSLSLLPDGAGCCVALFAGAGKTVWHDIAAGEDAKADEVSVIEFIPAAAALVSEPAADSASTEDDECNCPSMSEEEPSPANIASNEKKKYNVWKHPGG